MASHGGKIEIVASPYLSEEDMKAIQQGYQNRETYIKEAILRQIREEDVSDDYYTLERLNLLTKLIEDDILDIKIAYTEKMAVLECTMKRWVLWKIHQEIR